MTKSSFERWPCSVARTVGLLGDRWTLMVMRELFYGQTRFDQFVASLGIARTTLADRLDRLVDGGIVTREVYQREPTRHEYLLTEKGRDFFGVVAAINAWGDRWTADAEGVPVVMHHTTCGHQLEAVVTCKACREEIRNTDLSAQFGPGYPPDLRENSGVSERFR